MAVPVLGMQGVRMGMGGSECEKGEDGEEEEGRWAKHCGGLWDGVGRMRVVQSKVDLLSRCVDKNDNAGGYSSV